MPSGEKSSEVKMTITASHGLPVPDRLIVAIGGNAIHPAGMKGTAAELLEVAANTGRALRPLLEIGNEIVFTHGNGPGVGMILMRHIIARERVAPMSLDICVAHSQGGIAYALIQAMENALREVNNDRHVVCILTQVEVDPDDVAFREPSKPIGLFYSQEDAERMKNEMGLTMREDAGRGWRLIVPSPMPRHIVDISTISTLTKQGYVVVAGGGGGIPVTRDKLGRRHGVAAVIDKDLTTAHMGRVLDYDHMMILTAVPRVAINFGKPDQRELGEVSVSELKAHQGEGQFPAGSMGPKVEAAIRFIEQGGKRVIIGSLDAPMAALAGESGTHVVADNA